MSSLGGAGGFSAYGTALQAAGNVVAGRAARIQGRQQNREKQFEAQQFEQEANQSVAAGQRNAYEEKRKANLIASRAVALAAAGGGNVSDPGIVKVIADIEGEGAYRSAVALYAGEDQARRDRMAASAKRYEGAVAEHGGNITGMNYNIAGGAALLKGSSSLYEKYKGPKEPNKEFGTEFDNPDDYG